MKASGTSCCSQQRLGVLARGAVSAPTRRRSPEHWSATAPRPFNRHSRRAVRVGLRVVDRRGCRELRAATLPPNRPGVVVPSPQGTRTPRIAKCRWSGKAASELDALPAFVLHVVGAGCVPNSTPIATKVHSAQSLERRWMWAGTRKAMLRHRSPRRASLKSGEVVVVQHQGRADSRGFACDVPPVGLASASLSCVVLVLACCSVPCFSPC